MNIELMRTRECSESDLLAAILRNTMRASIRFAPEPNFCVTPGHVYGF